MLAFSVTFQLFAAQSGVPGAVDSICKEEKCSVLAVQGAEVKLVDQSLNRTIALGRYAPSARGIVPRTEAPVHDVKSPHGWRIIVSVYLDHDEDDFHAHLRVFGPNGKLLAADGVLSMVSGLEMGTLIGGNDDILAVTSYEEHAYNTETDVWLLPAQGDPRVLVGITGGFRGFIGRNPVRGVTMRRQTYDGEHAETKGIVIETYSWNPRTKMLTLDARK
jgi:hypothetical protein